MLTGFRAKNHPQQTRARGHDDGVNDRAVPASVFEKLNERFQFSVDAAASPANAKCKQFWTLSQNGLEQSWAGHRVWCNPPYSDIRPWVQKAWAENKAAISVLLLPANRTDQTWWHAEIEPHRDRAGSPLRVEFLPGRMRFLKPGQTQVGPNERPPFGCVLCIWDWSRK